MVSNANIKLIHQMVRKRGYGFNLFNPLQEPVRGIVIGERHANYGDYEFQGELIRLLGAKLVLHEFYDPNALPSPSEIVRIAIGWINRWKTEYGADLRSCDLSGAKIREFHELVYKFTGGSGYFSDEIDLKTILVDDNKIREIVMGKLIRKAIEKTEGIVIAIVGGAHIAPRSGIHPELRGERAIEIGGRKQIPYITINQDHKLAHMLEEGAKFFE